MNKIYECFICDVTLNELNCSTEHIILNSCGGKLKSRQLLCKKCNENMGADADAELAKQLNYFSTLANVDRDRGAVQPIKNLVDSNGVEYNLLPGEINRPVKVKPQIEKIEEGSQIEYKISGSSWKMIKQVLNKIQKEYPTANLNDAEEKFRVEEEYVGPLHKKQTFGGELAFRSVIKTAVSFFLHSGGEKAHIKHLIPYIRGAKDVDIVWFSLLHTPPYQLNEEEVSHVLYVRADRKQRIVFAYVDFFNSVPFFICLNNHYDGESFENIYCYDLINKKELQKEFLYWPERPEIIKITTKKQPDPSEFESISQRANRCLSILDHIQLRKQNYKIIEESLENAFKKRGNPTIFTQEVLNCFVDEYARKYVQMISNYRKEL